MVQQNNNDNAPTLIAITGGIGAGKSVVSSILRAMGEEVYDCDIRAREIMDSDHDIIEHIRLNICAEAVSDGKIDRKVLSAEVFSNAESLAELNRTVHAAVLKDLKLWSGERRRAFVETAILYTSGIDRLVDQVWVVTAPEDLRISRVLKRNPWLDAKEIKQRIESQNVELYPEKPHSTVREIINDGNTPLLPQIESLLKAI